MQHSTRWELLGTCNVLHKVMHAGSPEGLPKIQMLPLVLYCQASSDRLSGCFDQILSQHHDVMIVGIGLQDR